MAESLKQFRQIRDGLRQLADVPEHQLSNERLRQAILQQGLKPKRTAEPILSWLWMPVATCSAVAILLISMRSHSAPVQIVGSGTDLAMATNRESYEAMIEKTPPKLDITAGTTKPGMESRVAMINPDRLKHPFKLRVLSNRGQGRRSHRNYAVDPNLLAWFSGDQNLAYDGAEEQHRSGGFNPEQAGKNPSELKKVDDDSSDTVVLISTDKDSDTGAQKATEVASSSNVAAGG
jgi:hypothetical protein